MIIVWNHSIRKTFKNSLGLSPKKYLIINTKVQTIGANSAMVYKKNLEFKEWKYLFNVSLETI